MDNMGVMEWLTYATPLGLLLDIAGFLLIILFGHAIFQRTGSRVPPPSEGREGGGVSSGVRWEWRRGCELQDPVATCVVVVVGLVISGFTLQILGSFVSNLSN